MKRRNPQDYSQEEFEVVVNMLTDNPQMRANVEAITGHKFAGKTPRQIFDLWRACQKVNEINTTFVNYGRIAVALEDTRNLMETGASVAQERDQLRGEAADLKRRNKELTETKTSLQRTNDGLHRRIENITALPAKAINGEATSR